jgi:hypothetical protein
MTDDDRGLAALAATIDANGLDGVSFDPATFGQTYRKRPTTIAKEALGDRAVFLPEGLAVLEGHRICEENAEAEIARLRKIESLVLRDPRLRGAYAHLLREAALRPEPAPATRRMRDVSRCPALNFDGCPLAEPAPEQEAPE